MLTQKYVALNRGREHLLVPGLLIAAQDESIDDVESGKSQGSNFHETVNLSLFSKFGFRIFAVFKNLSDSWFRALVIESPENEEMIDQSSYFFRRFSKRNLRKFKKRRKFPEPVANHTFDGDDIETEMLNHKERVFKTDKVQSKA